MVLIKKNKKPEKKSKGYRLRISTHRLIDRIQIILNVDQDTAVTKACRYYYKILNQKHSLKKQSMKTTHKAIIFSLFILVFQTTAGIANEYVFPDDSEIASMLRISVSEFHRTVKQEMIDEHSTEVRKTGASNPDIGYEKAAKALFSKINQRVKLLKPTHQF